MFCGSFINVVAKLLRCQQIFVVSIFLPKEVFLSLSKFFRRKKLVWEKNMLSTSTYPCVQITVSKCLESKRELLKTLKYVEEKSQDWNETHRLTCFAIKSFKSDLVSPDLKSLQEVEEFFFFKCVKTILDFRISHFCFFFVFGKEILFILRFSTSFL